MTDVPMSSIDPDTKEDQRVARESSLVCRENRKLRVRVDELESQQADQLNLFRATLADRPSVNDLNAAKQQVQELEDGERERERLLEARVTELEELHQHDTGQLETQHTAHAEREAEWRDRERELQHELESLRSQLTSEKVTQASLAHASEQSLDELRQAREMQERLRSIERAAEEARREVEEVKRTAAENAKKQLGVHNYRVSELQAELLEARRRLIEAQGMDSGEKALRELEVWCSVGSSRALLDGGKELGGDSVE